MALILREKHVRTLLSMRDTIMILEEAFRALADGAALNQPRTRLAIDTGVLHILAAAAPLKGMGVLGLKTYTTFREGTRCVVMLYDAHNGSLLALIEADWLGAMRTGAASALATKLLARPDANVVGLIGAGSQAVTQLMGVCAVRSISTVYVYSRRTREREIFCREMSRLLKVHVQPVNNAQQAVERAQIVITATSSAEPVLQSDWLAPGCHINAIGSNWAHKREIDASTLQCCSLIALDSMEQAQDEAGDLLMAAEEGFFDWTRVCELTDLIYNDGPTRNSSDDITLYKGLGIALEDIVTAAHVYKLARMQGMGEEVDLLP